MVRGLVVACVALAALCVLQWGTLGQLKAGLASADARALQKATAERRDERVRAMTWLDAALRSEPGLNRPAGLCPDGRLDVEAVDRWLYGVYEGARAAGASEAESRRRVIEAVRARLQAQR